MRKRRKQRLRPRKPVVLEYLEVEPETVEPEIIDVGLPFEEVYEDVSATFNRNNWFGIPRPLKPKYRS